MLFKRSALFLTCATVLVLISCPLMASDWQMIKENESIQIYARPNPGSEIDEFKGTTVIPTGLGTLLALLRDIDAQPKWMDQCIEGKLIKLNDDYERIIYNVTDLPWPFFDRDVVVHQKLRIDDRGDVFITFDSVKEDEKWEPRAEGKVRMTTLKGSWTLEVVGKQLTRVTYIIKTDPEGNIPKWMANYASRFIPYKTLRNITQLVQEPQYSKNGRNFPTDAPDLTHEIINARLRSLTDEIINDTGLFALLQRDDRLIEQLWNAQGETKEIVQLRIKTSYTKKNGIWTYNFR